MNEPIECIICFKTLAGKDIYPSPEEPSCMHDVCKSCLCLYLKETPDGEYHLGYISLECLEFQCKNKVKMYIDNNADMQKHAYEWWKRLFQKKANIAYKIFCPMEGCGQVLESNAKLQQDCTFVICRSCNRGFCSACQNKWHTNVVKPINYEESRRLSLNIAKENNWCVCPRCKRIIDKINGCQHIYCICGKEICYRCGRLLFECKELCLSYDATRLKRLREVMFK